MEHFCELANLQTREQFDVETLNVYNVLTAYILCSSSSNLSRRTFNVGHKLYEIKIYLT